MDMELLAEKAAQIGVNDGEGDLSDNALDEGVWIMPSMRFNCSGNITSILLGVLVRVAGTAHPSIELWHQQDTNTYTKVSDSERDIMFDASYFSTTGPYRYNIIPPLSYSDGDVLAVRQPGSPRTQFYYTTSQGKIYKVASADEGVTEYVLHSGDMYMYTLLIDSQTG